MEESRDPRANSVTVTVVGDHSHLYVSAQPADKEGKRVKPLGVWGMQFVCCRATMDHRKTTLFPLCCCL